MSVVNSALLTFYCCAKQNIQFMEQLVPHTSLSVYSDWDGNNVEYTVCVTRPYLRTWRKVPGFHHVAPWSSGS